MGQAIMFPGGGGAEITFDAYTPPSTLSIYVADGTLTRTTPTALSLARRQLAATSVGDYALFGGGYSASAVVDAYDLSLTRSTPTALSSGRYLLAATSVGDYALFGGGDPTSAVVDAYRPEATGFYQPMPIGTKFNFGTEKTSIATENFIFTPATGWIKYKKGEI